MKKKLRDYFKLFRKRAVNNHDPDGSPGNNKYLPHQGEAEKLRRMRQAGL